MGKDEGYLVMNDLVIFLFECIYQIGVRRCKPRGFQRIVESR